MRQACGVLSAVDAASLVAYLTAVVYLDLRQSSLLFPAPQSWEHAVPDMRFEDLKVPVDQGGFLHAWWIPCAGYCRTTILAFHGNLLVVDYRGYGSSSPLSPDERSVLEDARAALVYLGRRGVQKSELIVLGRSIGSGPATQLALENPGLGGLILESPFTSRADAASRIRWLRIFPVRLLLRTNFDNLAAIGSVRVPVFVTSGLADTLTPPSMSERIAASAHEPKELYLVPRAGHDDLVEVGGRELTEKLSLFVAMHAHQ